MYLGGNFIKYNYLTRILKLSNSIDKHSVNSKNIINLGHLENLENFYNKIDVLCFPSYLNALGRQIFEAAYYKIPSIVCLKKNISDSFLNKKTGLSYKNPGSLKDLELLIKFFYTDRNQVIKMGLNANKLILKKFNAKKNYLILESIYFNSLKNKLQN